MSFPSLFKTITSSLVIKVAVTFWFVISVISYCTEPIGATLSIQLTTALIVPLVPLLSTNSNVNSPFSVNVYVSFPSLFVIVISVLGFTTVATTSWFVISVVLYSISAVGTTISSLLVISSYKFTIATDANIP